jgi:hypothetical protein
MADDKYDKVLVKARVDGLNKLSKNDLELIIKLTKEGSPRGREAKRPTSNKRRAGSVQVAS